MTKQAHVGNMWPYQLLPIRFVGGGHTTFCGFLNMGVHVVMYFYYLMSAMGPQVQKYLWWKR